jgi:hypothetical protein
MKKIIFMILMLIVGTVLGLERPQAPTRFTRQLADDLFCVEENITKNHWLVLKALQSVQQPDEMGNEKPDNLQEFALGDDDNSIAAVSIDPDSL